MTRKVTVVTCLVLCGFLISGLIPNLFADNGGGSQTESAPPVVPDTGFQQSDALRYGGLFGPLPSPEDLRGVGEFAQNFGQPIEPTSTEATGTTLPNSRDMGFGANVPNLNAINRAPACDPDALSCPGS